MPHHPEPAEGQRPTLRDRNPIGPSAQEGLTQCTQVRHAATRASLQLADRVELIGVTAGIDPRLDDGKSAGAQCLLQRAGILRFGTDGNPCGAEGFGDLDVVCAAELGADHRQSLLNPTSRIRC